MFKIGDIVQRHSLELYFICEINDGYYDFTAYRLNCNIKRNNLCASKFYVKVEF